MRVIVTVLATSESERGDPPDPAMFEAMGAFNDRLRAAGVIEMAEGVKPTSHGVRLRFDGARRDLRRGPFPLTADTLAGFWIWNVSSLDEAIEWARQIPNPMPGPSEVEIRPFFEPGDFEGLARTE